MKRCIVIGSGVDVVGRGLGRAIDAGRFGEVVRVNKPYGAAVDVGGRMDVLVTRWSSWVGRFFPGPLVGCDLVVLNEHVGFSKAEHRAACLEVGHRNVSAGVLACCWALNRGVKEVFVVGFGWDPRAGWAPVKLYPDGRRDENPAYDWGKEHRWCENNVILL